MFEAQEAATGWMDRLNPAQRQAVIHQSGPILVVAGAGSGKTFTLACRVAHLVEGGVPPERILLLTFTRRAAREMLRRAEHLTGRGVAGRVWGGTFHATGNRLLRMFGRSLGVPPDFTVLDQADGADLMNLIRGEQGLAVSDRRFPRKDTLAAIYSRTVNTGAPLSDVVERSFPWCADGLDGIRSIFRTYTTRKRDQNVLDYDDLLLHWLALARALGVGDRVARLFDHILVDEYQDTNAIQADILRAMRFDGDDLMVVGDDAQAIYAFRAATVRNILEFPRRFPGTRVVKLQQNYRSTPPILAASNAVIALSPQRHDKTLWSNRPGAIRPVLRTCLDEADQSEAVCRNVLDHRERDIPLRRQAVLFRAAHHSDRLEVELTRRNIPFVKYGGLKFLESAHVKDVLAVLRILENPRDEVSWFRVLQLLNGIGPATARRLMDQLGIRDRGGGHSPIQRILTAPPAVPPGSRDDLERLSRALADCSAPALPAASQVERVRRFCEPVFARLYAAADSRIRDVEQLEQIAGAYPTRARFLTDLTLDPPASTGDLAGPPLLDEDYLILSTIHSAKGGEWDVVHVIHAADGMIPSDMATGHPDEVEEERRLFYVALTRARDMLYVYFPLRFYRRPRGLDDAHSYAQLTRFLPPSVRAGFDLVGPDPVGRASTEPGNQRTTSAGGREAVDAYLGGLWGG
jgi:DNA helicase II / ATP-dependent DNA helicase PcrA